MKYIELKKFTNDIAFELGLKIIEIAGRSQQSIGVEIRRLNQTIFLYMGEGLSKDKNRWLERKAKAASHFMMSTKDLDEKLSGDSMLIETKYGLDRNEMTCVPGAIPVVVDSVGMCGVISVTGLKPEEDHQLIVDAVREYVKEV